MWIRFSPVEGNITVGEREYSPREFLSRVLLPQAQRLSNKKYYLQVTDRYYKVYGNTLYEGYLH